MSELGFGQLRAAVASMLSDNRKRKEAESAFEEAQQKQRQASDDLVHAKETLSRDLAKATDELRSMTSERNQLRDSRESDEKTINGLSQALASTKKRIEEHAERVVNAEELTEAKCVELENAQTQIAGFNHCAASFKESYEELQVQLKELSNERDQFADKLVKVRNIHKQLTGKIITQAGQIRNLEKSKAQLDAEVLEAQQRLQSEQDKRASLQQKNSALQKETERLQETIRNSRNDQSKTQQHNVKLLATIEQYQQLMSAKDTVTGQVDEDARQTSLSTTMTAEYMDSTHQAADSGYTKAIRHEKGLTGIGDKPLRELANSSEVERALETVIDRVCHLVDEQNNSKPKQQKMSHRGSCELLVQ